MVLPAITGKVEMVYEGEQQGAEVVARKLIGLALGEAVRDEVSGRRARRHRAARGARAARLRRDRSRRARRRVRRPAQRRRRSRRARKRKPAAPTEPAYDAILAWFAAGNSITLSDEQPFAEYFRELSRVPALADVARKYARPQRDEELAFWMELVLEGLHQALRLTREDLDSTITFQELMKFNVLRKV